MTPVLEVEDLVKHFPVQVGIVFKRTVGHVRAVDGVSFELHKGETLGVVGESGCGKSTLARLLLRLETPTSGRAVFDGSDVFGLDRRGLRRMRRRVQVVFQDPYRSLNPRRTVGASIVEGPMNYGLARAEAYRRARSLMALVNLDPDALGRYPHQFSGGQQQRIALALAMSCAPRVLVLDEPTTGLDVTTQARISELLRKLVSETGVATLYVSHDLALLAGLADRTPQPAAHALAELFSGRRLEQPARILVRWADTEADERKEQA